MYNIIELVDVLPGQPEIREARPHTLEETVAYLQSLKEETDMSVELWALSVELGSAPDFPPIGYKSNLYEGGLE
jgi:hypothetical protein